MRQSLHLHREYFEEQREVITYALQEVTTSPSCWCLNRFDHAEAETRFTVWPNAGHEDLFYKK